eukprot:scaffold3353_cov79-Cylindrotheca_fusiformis.AAC.2
MIVAEPSFEIRKVHLSQTLTLEYFLQPFVVIINEISRYQAVLCQQNGSILVTYLTFAADDCCGTIIPGSESSSIPNDDLRIVSAAFYRYIKCNLLAPSHPSSTEKVDPCYLSDIPNGCMIVAEPSFELRKVHLSQTLTLEYFLQPFVVIMNEISWYQAVLCQQNGSILVTYLTFAADDCCGTIIPGSESSSIPNDDLRIVSAAFYRYIQCNLLAPSHPSSTEKVDPC